MMTGCGSASSTASAVPEGSTGIGWTQPETLARLRGIKAEGGWAVVSTEETEIHPSADCEPFHEGRLWDDRDIPAMVLMVPSTATFRMRLLP